MNKPHGGKLSHSGLKPETQVTVGGRNPHAHHGYVNTPVYHASTLLYRTAEDYLGRRGQYTYGRRGTPTSEALETAIREIEGPACAGVALLPSGLAAISTALLAKPLAALPMSLAMLGGLRFASAFTSESTYACASLLCRLRSVST